MAWHPNRKQWVAMFATAVIAVFMWATAAEYSNRRDREPLERMALGTVVIGALVVWFLSGDGRRPNAS